MTINKKRKWKRIIAVVLTLCLLMNEQIAGFPMILKVIAEDADDCESDMINSEESMTSESTSESNTMYENNSTVESSVVMIVEESSTILESTVTESTESENSLEESSEDSEGNKTSETLTVTEDVSETIETSNTEVEIQTMEETGEVIEGESESKSETETQTFIEDETLFETETFYEEEILTESEIVSEAETETEELTEEELAEEELADMLLADTTDSAFPKTIDEFIEQSSSIKEFIIEVDNDFVLMQEYCKDERVNGFSGITFRIKSSKSGVWDMTKIGEFEGIGTKDHPFKGTIKCAFPNGSSYSFSINKPIIAYMGEGAVFEQMDITGVNSCAAVAQYIIGSVTINDVWVSGTFNNASGDEAGLLAAVTEPNSTLKITKLKSNGSVKVTDTVAGGFVGNVKGDLTIDMPVNTSTSKNIISNCIVKGSTYSGGYFGELNGDCTLSIANEGDIKFNAEGDATTYVGGIVGKAENVKLTLTTANNKYSISSNAKKGGYCGGIIGLAKGETELINSTGGRIIVTVGAESGSYAGGIIGVIDNSDIHLKSYSFTPMTKMVTTIGGIVGLIRGENTNCIIEDVVVTANIRNVKYVGGIVGEINGGICTINTATMNGKFTEGYVSNVLVEGGVVGVINNAKCIIKEVTVKSNNSEIMSTTLEAVGGIIGKSSSSTIELQGNITTRLINEVQGKYLGLIAGVQNNSLIYMADENTKIVDSTGATFDESIKEVGTYGGVYRNHRMADGTTLLIGDADDDASDVGVLNYKVPLVDGVYQMGKNYDFEALAIMLGTDGKYGKQAFPDKTCGELLSATYSVTADVDISYSKTGIVTLNKSDDTGGAFSGKLIGANDKKRITQNIRVPHGEGGLFTSITTSAASTPEFSNLIIDGEINNVTNVGGIAYQYIGGGVTHQLTFKNLTLAKQFGTKETVGTFAGRLGGVVAVKNAASPMKLIVDGLELCSTINVSGNANKSCGFIYQLAEADLDIKNVTLGGSININCSADGIGGFLGADWNNISGTIDGVSVQADTTYSTKGVFGALWTKLGCNYTDQKYVTLKNISLSGLTVDMTGNANPNCALLVSDATNLVANIIDYSSAGCTVINPGPYFDEVAGKTKAGADEIQVNSGIISLHNTANNYPDYHYQNRADVSTALSPNPYTLYFYDVFQKLEDGNGTVTNKISADNILDTPEEMLIWDIVQIANANVRPVFTRYFASGVIPNTELQDNVYSFNGTIDLTSVSFYPVPQIKSGVYNGNNANIKFGATAAMGGSGADAWGLPNNVAGQHYSLQSGLFTNNGVGTSLIISNITFLGNIANLGANSGVLLNGKHGLQGGGTFENIILDNLWIANYNKEPQTGLMLSFIPAQTAQFSGIKMINYVRQSDTKAASALIGSAGGAGVTNLVLKFEDMVIADDVDGNANEHNGDVLAHASFLYSYNYTDKTEDNKGSGLYLFSRGDFDTGIVTYGYELDLSTEFSDTSDIVLAVLGQTDSSLYKPYVYTFTQTIKKTIDVNPKTGDILVGCGTYEDPYLIETDKQFLTLYRYINETGEPGNYTHQTFYQMGDGWKLIKLGDDSSFCTNKHNVTVEWKDEQKVYSGTGMDAIVTFGDTDFPSPDELSRAYYRLGKDIDISNIQNNTYKKIAAEFSGFGTEERPFTGVWYGKGKDDVIHAVTLPDKITTYQYYGFIQYAKGAVVKDMVINSTSTSSTNGNIDVTKTVRIGRVAGGVIGVITGGDNIIDNVTANTQYMVASNHAAIGGYVGIVKKGGLILRNIDNTKLQAFKVDSPGMSPFIAAVIGKVEDGYAVYEGDTSQAYFWNGKGGNTAYNQVSNYQILNADYLKTASAGISIVANGEDYTVTIPNNAALQVMSMALNSDVLNIRPSDYANYKDSGYTEKSRCRKAAYSDLGCTSTCDDYTSAVNYDNRIGVEQGTKAYAYPYLYDYMGISRDSASSYLKIIKEFYTQIVDGVEVEKFKYVAYSLLNPSEPINGNYSITWRLAAGTEYDMSVFGDSFRGIGALYQTGGEDGGTFHGNFDGNGSTIILGMTRKLWGADHETATTLNAGLFNTLVTCNEAATLAMEKRSFKAADEETDSVQWCYKIGNFKLEGFIDVNAVSAGTKVSVGGVAGSVIDANYAFYNISADDLKIGENGSVYIGNFGGLIGNITLDTTNNKGYVYIDNCHITGSIDKRVVLKGTQSGGGLVGYANTEALKICDSSVNYIDIISNTEAAGFVGYSKWGKLILEGNETNYQTVANADIQGVTVGGFVGKAHDRNYVKYASCIHSSIGNDDSVTTNSGGIFADNQLHLAISDVSCENLSLKAWKNIGGIVAVVQTQDSKYTRTITNATVTDLKLIEQTGCDANTAGIGGIVGKNEVKLTITNADAKGTKTEDAYNFIIKGAGKKRKNHHGAGGIVGITSSSALTLEACQVDMVSISTDISVDSSADTNVIIAAGGIIGVTRANVTLNNNASKYISVTNLDIFVPTATSLAVGKMTSGGAFGYIGSAVVKGENTTSPSARDYYYEGIKAERNHITGKVSGGLAGTVDDSRLRLSGIEVKDGSVTASLQAGGMIGQFLPSSSGSAINPTQSVTDEPKNTVSDMSIKGKLAGGFCGYYQPQSGGGTANIFRIENLVIQDSEIISETNESGNRGAGGVIGAMYPPYATSFKLYDITVTNNTIANKVQSATVSLEEKDAIASGGLIGRISPATASTAPEFRIEYVLIADNNRIGIYTDKNNIQLIKADESGDFVLSDVNLPQASDLVQALSDTADTENVNAEATDNEILTAKDYMAIEKLESDYGYCVGNYVGVCNDTDVKIYVMDTDETKGHFEIPVMTHNPPVVDVGRNITEQDIDYYKGNCHVIYGASVNDAKNPAQNVAYMKSEADKALSDYDENTDTLQSLLKEIRVPKEQLELFVTSCQDSYQFAGTNLKMESPVIVYRVQNGTVAEVIKCINDVMTNQAGLYLNGEGILKISTRQMLFDGTASTPGADTASITVSAAGELVSTISDSVQDNNTKFTYTEITSRRWHSIICISAIQRKTCW